MTRSLNSVGLILLAVLVVAGTLFFFLREDPPKVVINEYLAHNVSCCPDSGNEYDDWIEIHNYGDASVDIGGMYMSQNKDNLTHHMIDDSQSELTTIPAGGYLVLWADGTPQQGFLHLSFKLDPDGEFLGLYDRHGRTVDTLTFKQQSPNVSMGRSPDAGKEWIPFTTPTPGARNQ